ncbi:acylneuraminate cytidylyltransferase family protein [Helicobacter marmotae]|uniref:Acylneuraminate cytidylyltransferase family protein n=1 Tax=Helicobacter marmotae TaxID=152490 RepID=A0A3D8I2U3_9HELI|nr:acylneuraminate cytidylyltransferase family protein [Helicobacter marmotae]RDU59044.1 acylneuraminate cytidylyltransferase family protein [Helicobacter marmotae]
MYKGKSFIAIIPARMGSKGLKDKNIKPLCGKPLLAWSIESALDCDYIDEVVVSTDSTLYADIALSYGASVPFIRPDSLSKDTTTTFEVLEHCINYYKEVLNKAFDYVVLLEPTSPLRERGDINRAIEQLHKHKDAQSIVGICATCGSNPAFLVHLDKGFIRPYENTNFAPIRRQEIKPVYFFEGSVYISQTHALLAHKNFYHHLTLGFEVPKWKSFEIDDEDDFIIIQALATHYKHKLQHKEQK